MKPVHFFSSTRVSVERDKWPQVGGRMRLMVAASIFAGTLAVEFFQHLYSGIILIPAKDSNNPVLA